MARSCGSELLLEELETPTPEDVRSRAGREPARAEDGRIEIDNNAAERALRTVALGRKNYLFAGSDAGGERAALIFSLIGTTKLNGVDPQAYLAHVIGCINAHPINRLEALLPWNVAPLLAGRSAEAAGGAGRSRT